MGPILIRNLRIRSSYMPLNQNPNMLGISRAYLIDFSCRFGQLMESRSISMVIHIRQTYLWNTNRQEHGTGYPCFRISTFIVNRFVKNAELEICFQKRTLSLKINLVVITRSYTGY